MIIENPYGFIYITTNLVNGKRYIGQKKFSDGWKWYLGSGKHLKEAIKKYGRNNFSRNIIAIAESKEQLDQMEIEIIDFLKANESRDYYNIADGGCVKGRSGKDAYWYGKKMPYYIISKANCKRNIPVYQFDLHGNLIGEYISATEAAAANGLNKQGISMSCKDETKTCGNCFWSFNKNRTNFVYDETKNHKPMAVLQYDKKTNKLVGEYESAKVAEMITGVNRHNLANCCRGRVPSAGGYTWQYKSR